MPAGGAGERPSRGLLQVRLHKTIHYRLDCAYVRVRRNVWLDAVDRVSR
jgi:hypothetical protein